MNKINNDELESIQKIINTIDTLAHEYGTISFEIETLKAKVESLKQEQEQIYMTYFSAKEASDRLSENLKEKYGNVTIDIETGTIT